MGSSSVLPGSAQLHPDSALRVRPWMRTESPYASKAGILNTSPHLLREYTSGHTSAAKSRPTSGMSELHPSGVMTRPVAPVRAKPFSEAASPLSSPPSNMAQVPINAMTRQEFSPKLLEFPFNESDYELLTDQRLGSGRFSDVFSAQPCEACALSPSSLNSSIPTPPATPQRGSFDAPRSQQPQLYAVKIPADRSSIPVLRSEATILSYLTALPTSSSHIISFHGLDIRTNSLVITALLREGDTQESRSACAGCS